MPKLTITDKDDVAGVIGDKAAELFKILDTVSGEAISLAIKEDVDPLDIVSAVVSSAATQLHNLTGSTGSTAKILIDSGASIIGEEVEDKLVVLEKRLTTIEAVARGRIHANMAVIEGLARDARDIIGFRTDN